MTAKKNEALISVLLRYFQFALAIAGLVMLTGCMVGRSWDTHTYDDNPRGCALPNLNGLTLYVDGDMPIIERALADNLKFVKKREGDINAFPVVKVRIYPPEGQPRGGWFFLEATALISVLSLSIVPGYWFESSEVHFQLTLPDKSGLPATTDFTYTPKRHFVSWFPLMVVYNFAQAPQVYYTQPKTSWSVIHQKIARQFFCDSKKAIDNYRASQEAPSNASQR